MTVLKDLPLTQRLFRAMALTVLTGSTVYCGFLTYGYMTNENYLGTDSIILVASVLLSTLACMAMTADAYDYLMRERHYALADVTKLELAALIILGVAFTASAFVVGPKLFITLTPAVVIYILLVVKPTNAEAQKAIESSPRQPKPRPRKRASAKPVVKRQRRGGRKR